MRYLAKIVKSSFKMDFRRMLFLVGSPKYPGIVDGINKIILPNLE